MITMRMPTIVKLPPSVGLRFLGGSRTPSARNKRPFRLVAPLRGRGGAAGRSEGFSEAPWGTPAIGFGEMFQSESGGPRKSRETSLTIGGSIFLIAIGAILYFATNLHVKHVSIDTVGLILMIAGAVGLVLGLVQQALWSRRSRREVLVEERRDPRDPPAY